MKTSFFSDPACLQEDTDFHGFDIRVTDDANSWQECGKYMFLTINPLSTMLFCLFTTLRKSDILERGAEAISAQILSK